MFLQRTEHKREYNSERRRKLNSIEEDAKNYNKTLIRENITPRGDGNHQSIKQEQLQQI